MEDMIYLVRIFGRSSAQCFEDAVLGKEVGVLGNSNKETFPSQIVSAYSPSENDSAVDTIKFRKNAEQTGKISSYFFYGTDLDELRENIETLAFQPTGSEAYEKILNKKSCTAEDFYAHNRYTMAVIQAPFSLIASFVKSGLAELREGKYGTDEEYENISEVALGDPALLDIIKQKSGSKILAYGKMDDIMNNTGIFPDADAEIFDENNYFSHSSESDEYLPSFTIGPKIATKKNAEQKGEIDNARKEIESRNDLSDADKALLLDALSEAAKSNYTDDDFYSGN